MQSPSATDPSVAESLPVVESAEDQALAPAKATILVVDDDEDYLLQEKLQLEAAGFRVTTAAGEQQAEAMLGQSPFDLVVLDLMMENSDSGFTLAYHIKKSTPSLPVILVTAAQSQTGLQLNASDPRQRNWLKADAVLSKPIRFEQLKQHIDRLLQD